MLNFCDFIHVFVFTRNHHLNETVTVEAVVPVEVGHGVTSYYRIQV